MVMLLQVEKVVHYFINLGENQFRDFMGRRALRGRDYVDSIRDGPWLLNQKFIFDEIRPKNTSYVI